MAIHNVYVAAQPEQAWEVLADPYSYTDWVVGTKDIEDADPAWPKEGSTFRYRAGAGMLSFSGQTIVRAVEPGSHLELEADARLMAARVSLSLRSWGDGSLIAVEEHWIRGPAFILNNPLTDVSLDIRNRLLVRNLAKAIQARSILA